MRELTRDCGILLIFDEVITGFRLALAGAAERFGFTPDLHVFGKTAGGGFPIGVYGGRRDVMEAVVTPRGAGRQQVVLRAPILYGVFAVASALFAGTRLPFGAGAAGRSLRRCPSSGRGS